MSGQRAFDAVVVGGGLLGTALAYHLVRAGARTLLIDRADTGRATDAGAGILSPETNSRDPEAWFRLACEAVDYYPALIEQPARDQDGDTGYARCGKLVVAVSDDEVEPFARARRIIFERRQRRGSPSLDDLREVSAAEARELFPALAPVHGAIYSRIAARVDGRLLNRALLTAATRPRPRGPRAGGGAPDARGRGGAGRRGGGEPIAAGAVAIAGGAWSETFGKQLGVSIPVEPQRGQIIHLGLRGTDTSRWPMVSAFHHHYLVAWPDSRVVAGATRETGSGFAPHTTAAGVREVLAEALRVAPGLARGRGARDPRGAAPVHPRRHPGARPGARRARRLPRHGPRADRAHARGVQRRWWWPARCSGEPAGTDLAPYSVARFA